MLSVSNWDYQIPAKVNASTPSETSWLMKNRKGSDKVLASQFNYTIHLVNAADDSEGRLTFTYDGVSVKPTSRTLRIYGSECISRIVSVLCSITTKNYPDMVERLHLTLNDVLTGVELR